MGGSPIVPQREAKQRENSQGAKRNLTDGWHTKAAFNRREAEMGFGDEIPKRGMGLRACDAGGGNALRWGLGD